jgi:hypothetical protein
MRKCVNSAGVDVTADCASYLATNPNLTVRHLYLIGYPEDPNAIFLTDHEAPIEFLPWGVFNRAIIKRGTVKAAAGLEIQKTTVSWTPGNLSAGVTIATANPVQLARIHYYDNWPVRIWKCFLPNNSFLGACEWFGGRVGNCEPDRSGVVFNVKSFLNVVTQKVPANVIESTSTLAGYTAASRPVGDTSQPTFSVFDGSTTNIILADTLSPTANHIYDTDVFVAGYMVFLDGPGATLPGVWSAIGGNLEFTDGHANNHNQFNIYTPLPWAPTPGVDTFYVSTAAPINFGDDANFCGFPFVPQPSSAA